MRATVIGYIDERCTVAEAVHLSDVMTVVLNAERSLQCSIEVRNTDLAAIVIVCFWK